jgi:tRNA (cytidine/uridine-2'-O-)-methyltransferase
MNIVLVNPEIPQNTGNIARTCAATKTALHLVRPLGFSTDDRYLKRAGLDYWDYVEITYYENIREFFSRNKGRRFFYASTKAGISYDEMTYRTDDFLVFGKETKGLDEDLLRANQSKCVRIPMAGYSRSLNLSNSVAIVLYEALRQQGFDNLKRKGILSK